MTSKVTIFAALAMSLVVISCKKDLEPQESSIPLAAANANPAQPGQTAVQPQQAQAPQPQQVQMQPQQIQKVAPGMNPPHGQPGHRCDIPVGSPLSQPIKTAATQPATVTQVQPTQVKTAPGMNPPHGQPGHRCDIAVGTPLSQPVKVTSTQYVNAANAKEPITITPATINADGSITPGTGVNITKTQAPAMLQDNSKPAEQK